LVFKNISHFNLPTRQDRTFPSISQWATLPGKLVIKASVPPFVGVFWIYGMAFVGWGGGRFCAKPQQLAKPNAPHIVGFFTVPTNNNQNIKYPPSPWLPLGIRFCHREIAARPVGSVEITGA